MDRAEAEWLERLAEFDRSGAWATDGQLTCASWLVCRTKMSRSTAFEKLRVAHELSRRPVVAAAFREGRLSYSAARTITRMVDPEPEVDQALVTLAEADGATIVDLERTVRAYRLYADQQRPLGGDPPRRRDVRIVRGEDGTGQVVVTLSDTELEEFDAAFRAFLDAKEGPVHDSPVDESSREDGKADAFMEMVATALAGAGGGQAAGDDRYPVHLIRSAGSGAVALIDGRPLPPDEAGAVACDASSVTHTIGEAGEPLSLGRKTRDWSVAQRRAMTVRDGGHCRFPGCWNRFVDVHHKRPWEDGGATDVDNGLCACRRHHRMLHGGYGVEGDPNSELRFVRPDGSYLGSTFPGVRWAVPAVA